MQNTIVRIMDSNEYDALLTGLAASFDQINEELIIISIILMAGVVIILRHELKMLDVITLGKEQAIHLGVDYDRTIQKLLLGIVICIAIAITYTGLIISDVIRKI